MSTVPKRLVAISAAIPTGETCDGCDYENRELRACKDGSLLHDRRAFAIITDGIRPPECKARDRYLVVEPGSAVGELLRALDALRRAEESHNSTVVRLLATPGMDRDTRKHTYNESHRPLYGASDDARRAMFAAEDDPAVRAWVEATK